MNDTHTHQLESQERGLYTGIVQFSINFVLCLISPDFPSLHFLWCANCDVRPNVWLLPQLWTDLLTWALSVYQQTAQANVDASSSAPTTAVQVMKAWVIFRDHRCVQKKNDMFLKDMLCKEKIILFALFSVFAQDSWV